MATENLGFQTFLINLTKLVPAEIITAYMVIQAFLPHQLLPTLIVGAALLVMTPLYLIFAMKIGKPMQVIISSLSFVVWLFAIGGPFVFFAWYHPWLAGLVLCIYTMLPPMIYGTKTGVTVNITLPTAPATAARSSKKSWREI